MVRTSSRSTRPSATRSTSTTTATARPTSSTSSGSRHIRKAKNFAGIPTFLYNDGAITSLTDPNLLVWQTYDVWRNGHQIAWNVRVPPANIGPRSTADYSSLASAAVRKLSNGTRLFAGQRDDAFFVDLGSIFDLAGLRPFNTLHALSLPAEPGVDGVSGFNTNSIAIRVPLRQLTKDHRDCRPARTIPTPSSACGPRPAGRRTVSSTRTARCRPPARGSRSPASAIR